VILRDEVRKLHFEGTFGRQAVDNGVAESVVGGAVFVSHDGDLAGDAVTDAVEPGALLAFPGAGARGLLSVFAVGAKLSFGEKPFEDLRVLPVGLGLFLFR
jgi:hypothetical protein